MAHDGPDGADMTYRVSYTEALREVKHELSEQNKVLENVRQDLRTALSENKDLKDRVRALELRFYGILAGLVTAIGVLIYQGGA